MALNA